NHGLPAPAPKRATLSWTHAKVVLIWRISAPGVDRVLLLLERAMEEFFRLIGEGFSTEAGAVTDFFIEEVTFISALTAPLFTLLEVVLKLRGHRKKRSRFFEIFRSFGLVSGIFIAIAVGLY